MYELSDSSLSASSKGSKDSKGSETDGRSEKSVDRPKKNPRRKKPRKGDMNSTGSKKDEGSKKQDENKKAGGGGSSLPTAEIDRQRRLQKSRSKMQSSYSLPAGKKHRITKQHKYEYGVHLRAYTETI